MKHNSRPTPEMAEAFVLNSFITHPPTGYLNDAERTEALKTLKEAMNELLVVYRKYIVQKQKRRLKYHLPRQGRDNKLPFRPLVRPPSLNREGVRGE